MIGVKIANNETLWKEVWPWYWGRAYRRFDLGETVMAWIPFNLIIGFWMNGLFPRLRKGYMGKRIEEARRAGFEDGRKAGRYQGIAQGREEQSQAIFQNLKEYLAAERPE